MIVFLHHPRSFYGVFGRKNSLWMIAWSTKGLRWYLGAIYARLHVNQQSIYLFIARPQKWFGISFLTSFILLIHPQTIFSSYGLLGFPHAVQVNHLTFEGFCHLLYVGSSRLDEMLPIIMDDASLPLIFKPKFSFISAKLSKQRYFSRAFGEGTFMLLIHRVSLTCWGVMQIQSRSLRDCPKMDGWNWIVMVQLKVVQAMPGLGE